MTELEIIKERERLIRKDTDTIENRIRHAFNQGVELGKRIMKEKETVSPCDLCKYNPPSSGDGKPCTMCPADATERFKNKLESGYFRKRREV